MLDSFQKFFVCVNSISSQHCKIGICPALWTKTQINHPCCPTDRTCLQGGGTESMLLVPTAVCPGAEMGIVAPSLEPSPTILFPSPALSCSLCSLGSQATWQENPFSSILHRSSSPGPLPGSLRPASKPFVRLPEGRAACPFFTHR